jgi:hypothetical protein
MVRSRVLRRRAMTRLLSSRVTPVRTRLLPAVVSVVLTLTAPTLVAPPANAGTASPSPTPSSSARASEQPRITFGLGPATDQQVDRRSGFNLVGVRGARLVDQVAIVNLAREPLTVNLYAADIVNGADGSLQLAPSAAEPVDAARWVRFATPSGQRFVTVAPRATVVVPLTVTVPDDAFVGDHLAGVVASVVARGQAPGQRGTDVELEQRIAVRLAVRVGGVLAPQLVVEDVDAGYAGVPNPLGAGTATVRYTVRNTGNVRLGGAQQVVVSGVLGGSAAASSVPDIPMLLPGGSATVSVPVAEVRPVGLMTATVTVTALGAAGDANPPSEVATGSTSFWAVPWLLLAMLLLLVAMVALWRRRVVQPPAAPTGRREAASSSALVGSEPTRS